MNKENSRIAKNTMYMYFRLFFSLCINLYMSREVLRVLGVEDYGLYNVIGGIISMFGFLNGAMTNTTSRYLTFYLGQKNMDKLNNIFNMFLLIHFIIALIILTLGETVGLWFLYNKMVIPEGRMFAAEWLYQLSVASSFIMIIGVPFNSSVISHEKMSVFAFITIMDVVLKLVVVLALQWSPFDKLIFYGTMFFLIQVLDVLLYFLYCKKNFVESKFKYYWNKPLFKSTASFAGWSMFGNFAYLFYNQGLNLLLNMFCGPAVNAARGIAVQVDGVVKQFASNIQTAINPQIIKSYANNDLERMHTLIFASTRYCYYLLFLLSLPIMVETQFILTLWLGNVPAHTISFIRITLVVVMLEAFINPMFTANLASGKVRTYQITLSIISYAFMPITYFAIKLTKLPESVFLCYLACVVVGVIVRVFILRRQVKVSIGKYLRKVVCPIGVVTILSVIIPLFLHLMMNYGMWRFIIVGFVCLLSVLCMAFLFGVSNSEKLIFVQYVRNKIQKNN